MAWRVDGEREKAFRYYPGDRSPTNAMEFYWVAKVSVVSALGFCFNLFNSCTHFLSSLTSSSSIGTKQNPLKSCQKSVPTWQWVKPEHRNARAAVCRGRKGGNAMLRVPVFKLTPLTVILLSGDAVKEREEINLKLPTHSCRFLSSSSLRGPRRNAFACPVRCRVAPCFCQACLCMLL